MSSNPVGPVTPIPGHLRAAAAGLCAVVLLNSGCGESGPARHASAARSSARPAASVCLPEAREAIARFLAVQASGIAAAASTGNNSMPECSFSVRVANGKRVEVTADVDTSPQPYFRLERTAIEATQAFLPGRAAPVADSVSGLGLEADWFPAETQLMSTDGVRLLTVTVSWSGATQQHERALAEALSQTYLRVSGRKGAGSLARGYPSP